MYLKDKKTVNIGSMVTICVDSIINNRKAKVLKKMSTGSFMLNIINSNFFYYMKSDFTILGYIQDVLYYCKPIKKIKYKRKRYKNG